MAGDKAGGSGDFAPKWRVKKSMTQLRVVLQPYQVYAASIAKVPAAPISGCKVTKRGGGSTLKCSTTAKDGSRVRLLKNGKAASFSRVKKRGLLPPWDRADPRVQCRHHCRQAPHPPPPLSSGRRHMTGR